MLEVNCACGCGTTFPKLDKKGRERKYVHGHYTRVHNPIKSQEARKKLSESMMGAKNHQWNPNRSMIGRVGQGFQKSQRKRLLGDSCLWCGAKEKLNLDHIVPIFAGGTNDDRNAQTLCFSCNQKKRTWEISHYGKLGEFGKTPNPYWMGNTELSKEGNFFVCVTARGRVYRKAGTRFMGAKLECDNCERPYVVSMWKLRGYKTRPEPKHHFCSDSCRLRFLNSKTVNSSTSARPERDDIACANGTTVRCSDKKPNDNKKQAKWVNYAGTITIFGDEMRQNAGDGKLYDLVKAKTMQSVMSARDALAIDQWATTAASKKIAPLDVLIDATSSVQDINSSTNSWWQAQVVTSGSFAARGLADMRNLRDLIISQGQAGVALPDKVITTQLIYELYEQSQLPQLRYSTNDDADASFGSLMFSGASVAFDPNCVSGSLYMLTSDALQLVVHSDAEWTIGQFKEPVDQDVRTAKIIWMGNLVTTNRRRLGKMTSITA